MEVESKPEEIENLDRRIIQLKIEREALKKEKRRGLARTGSKTLEQELANLEQQSAELTTALAGGEGQDRRRGQDQGAARRRADRAGAGAARAATSPRPASCNTAASPSWRSSSPRPRRRRKGAMLREEVTDQDIAAVVSRWTGIPVERMLEGEREKLLNMEEAIGAARDRPGRRRSRPCRAAVRRARAGLQDPNRPLGSFLFLGPDRRRQDRADQGARRIPVRRSARDGPHRHVANSWRSTRSPG